MTAQDNRSAGDSRPVTDIISSRVVARAGEWFPDAQNIRDVTVRPLSMRPRCSLYLVRLTIGLSARIIVAKVRKSEPDRGHQTATRTTRPRLRAERSSVAELTAREYDGLRSIHEWVGVRHHHFGSVRPLDHVPEQSLILMDHVDQYTLRQRFIAESRLSVVGRLSWQRRPAPMAWRNAGAWLRAYHDATPRDDVPVRQSRRADVVDRLVAYGEFLAARVGARALGDTAVRAADRAASVLPDRLPMAVGHGDYVVRNMFADADGRITVFDPMPRWQTPRYEDLCRFLVGMRLLGLQQHSRGLAYSRRVLDLREAQFLAGYYGEQEIPRDQIRCFQVLIMLDKWSALVDLSDKSASWRSRLRARATPHRFIGAEVRRLLDVIG